MGLTIYPVAAISTPAILIFVAIGVVLIALIVGLVLMMKGKKKDPDREDDEPLMRTKKGTDDSAILSGDEQITVSLDTTGDFLADGIMAETPADGEGFQAFEEGGEETLINVDMGDGWEDFGKGDSSFEENSDASPAKESPKASAPAPAQTSSDSTSGKENAPASAQSFSDYQGSYDEAEDETSVLGAAPTADSSFEHITAQSESDSEEEGASLLGDDAFSSGRGVGHRRSAQKEQQAIYYQDSFNSTGSEEKSTDQGIPRAFVFRVGTEERKEINKNKFSIGKSQNADYTVSGNNKISRVHAIVIYEKGSFFLADNHSSNHTYLEDQELNPDRMYELTEGSRIRLANEEFVFHLL